jgi:hypothetical protein
MTCGSNVFFIYNPDSNPDPKLRLKPDPNPDPGEGGGGGSNPQHCFLPTKIINNNYGGADITKEIKACFTALQPINNLTGNINKNSFSLPYQVIATRIKYCLQVPVGTTKNTF